MTPFARATLLECWIVGPSAMGSVKGRPSSIISVRDQSCSQDDHASFIPTPPACRPNIISGVSSAVGKPLVK